MADELQALLDRITEDGVEKAEAQRAEILAKAKEEAAAILRQAKEEADQLKETAARETELLRKESEQAVRQAARDVKLALSAELRRQVPHAISSLLGETMQPEGLASIIAAVCTAFLQADGQQTNLQLLVPPAQLEQLDSAVKARLADGFRERCEFSPSRMLKKGFKLTFKGQDVV